MDGGRNHAFIWLFLAPVAKLTITVDSPPYLCANRAVTFTGKDPLAGIRGADSAARPTGVTLEEQL